MTDLMELERSTKITLAVGSLFIVGMLAAGLLWVAHYQGVIDQREREVIENLLDDAQWKCRGDKACIEKVARLTEKCVRINAKYKPLGNQMSELVGVKDLERFYACVGVPRAR